MQRYVFLVQHILTYLSIFRGFVETFNPCPLALGDSLTLYKLRVTVLIFQRIILISFCWHSLLLSALRSLHDR